MKKILLIFLCLIVAAFSFACSVKNTTTSKSSQSGSSGEGSSPFTSDEGSDNGEESKSSISKDPSEQGWGKDHLI